MSAMLSEKTHLVKGIDPIADAFAGTVRSDVVNMANFARCRFIVYRGVGATGTSTITVNACDDVVPTTRSAIPFTSRDIASGDTPGALTARAAAGYIPAAGSSTITIIEVDAADLGPSGYGYVELTLAESVDSPVLAGVLIELYEPKHSVTTGTRATT